LGLAAGLIAAGLARDQVTHLPAHELSNAGQRRRRRHAHQTQTRAARTATTAPLTARTGDGVLGAWIGGW
jgi:ribosomal protein S30